MTGRTSMGPTCMRPRRTLRQPTENRKKAATRVNVSTREISIEECGRPTELRQNEYDCLADDQQSIEDGPKYASGLIGNSASPKKLD
ncbi:hypothetical protein WG66_003824 [Moniliophthora roreri]|nr:hypothetical protein WG66_003824 [Moniliophthora roreri]